VEQVSRRLARARHAATRQRLCSPVALTAGLLPSFASASPSLTLRDRLIRCLNAVNGIYVGPVKARTPQVAILNRKVQVVRRRCDGDSTVLGTRTGRALFDLSLGVGDYQQYLIDVAFEHPDRSLLREAQREIARGKAEARRVLG
jgi:uncharacterized short protein YbdD (DUF466 family)